MSPTENEKSKDVFVIIGALLLVLSFALFAPNSISDQKLKSDSLSVATRTNPDQILARKCALALCDSIEKKDINALLAIWYNKGETIKEKIKWRQNLSKKFTQYFDGKTDKDKRAYSKLMEQIRGIQSDMGSRAFILSGDTRSEGTLAYKYRNFKKTKKATLSIIRVKEKFKITDID